MASEWAMVIADDLLTRLEIAQRDYLDAAVILADALDAAREQGRNEAQAELAEWRRDKERLEYLFRLRSPYFSRSNGSVALIETDCGVMRVVGAGNNEREAIDAAMKGARK